MRNRQCLPQGGVGISFSRITIVLCAIIVSASLCSLWGCNRSSGPSAVVLEKRISQELQVGCSYTRVLDYLDKNRIEHSEYILGDDQSSNGVRGTGRITGIVRNVRSSAFSTVNLRLVFLFDANGGLISSRVTESIVAM